MLQGITGFCKRQTIFLSYSSADAKIAEKIAQVLINEGHKVFFDKRTLEAGDKFDAKIRHSIEESDRFIFLIGKDCFQPGKYTLTELGFAESKWPSPVGVLLPVIVDPEASIEAAPNYISSVHIYRPKGSAPAEVAALIAKSAKVKPRCWVAAGAMLFLIAGLASSLIGIGRVAQGEVEVELEPWATVAFEPLKVPPQRPDLPDAPRDWLQSETTITISYVSYNVRSTLSRPATVLNEQIELHIGDRKYQYAWRSIVDTSSDACKIGRCAIGAVAQHNLGSGVSKPRQTLYQSRERPPSWRAFYDYFIAAEKAEIRMTFRATVDVPSGERTKRIELVRTCHFNVLGERNEFREDNEKTFQRYLPGGDLTGKYLQWKCLLSSA